MPIAYDANGVPRLQPRNLNLEDFAREVCDTSPEEACFKHKLTSNERREVARELAALYRNVIGPRAPDSIVNASVNNTLANFALCFPPYGTSRELHAVDKMLCKAPPAVGEVQQLVFAAVMNPRMRALQSVGRFLKLKLFAEFAYLIDSAALSFYRGNLPSALMTIIPVVEGVLLRWQGYPSLLKTKPGFKKTLKFVQEAPRRQPLPLLPLFFDSWVDTAWRIMRDHLFRDSSSGPAVDHFNRHLALHLLEEQRFCTTENVTRAFLLLDVLSDIYICEKRIKDPRWETEHDEELLHLKAYVAALSSQKCPGQPEKSLSGLHATKWQ